ncbi:MAG: hypothetical protein JNM30_04565 [Rhodospirillales bacterium]|nr:hypothetical protein [Rhodospirillales bacterium]
MSFSIYVSAFHAEDSAWIPIDDIRERFSRFAISESGTTMYLQFSSPALPATELGFEIDAGEMIDGFFANHPPDEIEFWDIIAGILRDHPCLLYWPGTSAVMGSLDLLPHIPKVFVEKLGIPFVSTDGETIRRYVGENS